MLKHSALVTRSYGKKVSLYHFKNKQISPIYSKLIQVKIKSTALTDNKLLKSVHYPTQLSYT